eukprot:COSAG03_NODE_6732_length_1014_cov_1.093989_2_plen_57_part_01
MRATHRDTEHNRGVPCQESAALGSSPPSGVALGALGIATVAADIENADSVAVGSDNH